MKIIVDNEIERRLIISLCDVGLKNGGMESFNGVQMILGAVVDAPVKEVKLPDNDGPDT